MGHRMSLKLPKEREDKLKQVKQILDAKFYSTAIDDALDMTIGLYRWSGDINSAVLGQIVGKEHLAKFIIKDKKE
jgi:hypothetical protein